MICIHPDPQHVLRRGEKAQLQVQVKSCYATDCNHEFEVKEKSFDAFDFLVVTFLNIGKYGRGRAGEGGMKPVEFYTLSNDFIRERHNIRSSWHNVLLKKLQQEIEPFRNDVGFELIAAALGVEKPTR